MAINDSQVPQQGNDGNDKTKAEKKRKNSDYAEKSSDSETTSSDDEVVSDVSLHQGLNPCKCCTHDDECNLRSFCIGIGILEISFWLVLIFIAIFTGLITRGSEPVVHETNGTRPTFKRESSKNTSGREIKKASVPPYASLITLPPIIVGDKVLGSNDGNDGSGGVETTTRFETYLQSEYGEAMRIIRPDTDSGLHKWKENLNNYLVAIVVNFVCIVSCSVISGLLCFGGAHGRKIGILRLHILAALLTSLFTLTLGILFILIQGFTQAAFCILCACFYIYFAVCSHGLVTVIKAGVFDDFDYEGVAYTYSTVLRAKVKKKVNPEFSQRRQRRPQEQQQDQRKQQRNSTAGQQPSDYPRKKQPP